MPWSMDDSLDTASSLLGYAVSTIASPSFFQVVVVYQWHSLRGLYAPQYPIHEVSQDVSEAEALRHQGRFGVLRKAHQARDFQLVLSAEMWDPEAKFSVQILKEVVAGEKAEGGFGDFLPEPLVTCHPLRSRTIDHGEVDGYDKQLCTT